MKSLYQLLAILLISSLLSGCRKEKESESDVPIGAVGDSSATIASDQPENAESPSANDTYENDNDNGGEACFEKSEFNLPYNQSHDPEKAVYKTVPCEIEGAEEFLCNNRGLRYLPLPKFKDVDVVLAPMDCGDFKYRYFLLTIFHKVVVANQYVEGQWYEPGAEETKEATTFSIDTDYKITISTSLQENGRNKLKEKKEFQLQPDGKLLKL